MSISSVNNGNSSRLRPASQQTASPSDILLPQEGTGPLRRNSYSSEVISSMSADPFKSDDLRVIIKNLYLYKPGQYGKNTVFTLLKGLEKIQNCPNKIIGEEFLENIASFKDKIPFHITTQRKFSFDHSGVLYFNFEADPIGVDCISGIKHVIEEMPNDVHIYHELVHLYNWMQDPEEMRLVSSIRDSDSVPIGFPDLEEYRTITGNYFERHVGKKIYIKMPYSENDYRLNREGGKLLRRFSHKGHPIPKLIISKLLEKIKKGDKSVSMIKLLSLLVTTEDMYPTFEKIFSHKKLLTDYRVKPEQYIFLLKYISTMQTENRVSKSVAKKMFNIVLGTIIKTPLNKEELFKSHWFKEFALEDPMDFLGSVKKELSLELFQNLESSKLSQMPYLCLEPFSMNSGLGPVKSIQSISFYPGPSPIDSDLAPLKLTRINAPYLGPSPIDSVLDPSPIDSYLQIS